MSKVDRHISHANLCKINTRSFNIDIIIIIGCGGVVSLLFYLGIDFSLLFFITLFA